MKISNLIAQWQKRLAKISLILVCFLVFEAVNQIFSGYAGNGFSWAISDENVTKKPSEKTSEYNSKLNGILEQLQKLQEQGKISNVRLAKKFGKPSVAIEGKSYGNYDGSDIKVQSGLYSPKPCPLGIQPSIDWGHDITPRFKLNPYKFLYPILKNEPIDQLIGLRQSILLAIKLNRTLALPYFHNHNYGGYQKYNPPIPAQLKINIDMLRHFISVIPITTLQRRCNNEFDAAFLTGDIDVLPGIPSLLKAQSETEIKMLNTMNTTLDMDFQVSFSIPTFPKSLKVGEKISVPPTSMNLEKIYPKEANGYRCVVHPHPLSALDVDLFLRKALKLPNYKVELKKIKNEILYSAIWYYTQPPLFILELANKVIENVIHAHQVDGIYNFLCLNYHKFTTENRNTDEDVDSFVLQRALQKLLQKIKKESKSFKITGIYISSPRSKQDVAQDVRENIIIMDSKNKVPIYTSDDIIRKWKSKYFNGNLHSPDSLCSLLEDSTQDFLSLVEMQVCIDAAVFIRSVGSSWAANVQANRAKSKYSELDVSVKELLDNFKKSSKTVKIGGDG